MRMLTKAYIGYRTFPCIKNVMLKWREYRHSTNFSTTA